jgi:hypothetical protein
VLPQLARALDVGGALDQRAAVGEDADAAAVEREAQHALVPLELARARRQTLRQGGERRVAVARRDLHGVAPAQRECLAAGTVEVHELLPRADAALRIARRAEPARGAIPGVEFQQGRLEGLVRAREQAQGEAGGEGGDRADRGQEDAGGVAGRERAVGRRGGEEAREARRAPGEDREHEPGGADDARVDPRDHVLDRVVVDQVARLEVVRAVEDQVDVVREELEVARVDVRDVRVDERGTAAALEALLRRHGLRRARVRVSLVEQDLAREVGELDHVAIDQDELADARAEERLCQHAAQRPAADHEDARRDQAGLTGGPERGEAHLPVEAPREVAVHAMRRRCPGRSRGSGRCSGGLTFGRAGSILGGLRHGRAVVASRDHGR